MKRLSVLAVLLSVLVIGAGCAKNQHISQYALTNPIEAISLPHPVQLEEIGIEAILSFSGRMDPGLWPETLAGGGVWPALALSSNGEIFKGYAYLAGMTYWGDFLLQFLFFNSRETLADVKILYLNRDAGWVYQLGGKEIDYDSKKFDSDQEYQREIFGQHGWTFSQIDAFWLDYLKGKGLNPSADLSGITEIKVKTPEWEDFKKKLSSVLKYNYKMGDGEIRLGYLPLEDFRQAAVINPEFTPGQKFLKNLRIPIFIEPIGLAVSAANAMIASGVDSDINGYYARAKVMRRRMAPVFRYLCQSYQELLKKRDERIEILERKIRFERLLAN